MFNVLQQTEGNTEMKFFLSLILSRAPFPHSLSISSHFLIFSPFPLNFLILSPFPHSLSIFSFSFHFSHYLSFHYSLSITSFSVHFLILCPFPHSLSISSFSVHFLILCSFPYYLSIFSPFPHYLSISSQPCCKAAASSAALVEDQILKYYCKFHRREVTFNCCSLYISDAFNEVKAICIG